MLKKVRRKPEAVRLGREMNAFIAIVFAGIVLLGLYGTATSRLSYDVFGSLQNAIHHQAVLVQEEIKEHKAAAAGHRAIHTPAAKNGWVALVRKVIVTFYCPCEKCCGKWAAYGLTKSGDSVYATQGAAADLSIYPLGSKIKLPGSTREIVINDSGKKVKGSDHFDVLVTGPNAHERALVLGRGPKEVTIIMPSTSLR